MPDSPTVEGMIAELIAAGWTRHSATVWRAPGGGLFRGPYGAWKVMNAMRIGRKKASVKINKTIRTKPVDG